MNEPHDPVERHRLAFLPGIVPQLGWYVYALRDPRDGTVFYVGKGRGNRAFQHARSATGDRQSRLDTKTGLIREIHFSGHEVIVEIVRHNLPSEAVAFEVETAVIDALQGVERADLRNRVKGHGRDERGWASLDALQRLAAPAVDIPDELRPGLLIRPREQFRYGMSEPEIWEITRKYWKIRHRPDDYYRYAFCVHDAVVQGVWKITGWDPEASDWTPRQRRGFLGEPAWDLWATYVGGYVGEYLPSQGGQSPFTILMPSVP